MPQLRERLTAEGASLTNFFVNTPICCPSRTEFFTGRYFHNVGPPNDPGGSCMHADTALASSNATGLFGLLRRAGYNVGIFGKVTNDQGPMLARLTAAGSASVIDSPVDFNNFDGLPYYRQFANGSVLTETLDTADPVFGTTYQTTQIGNRTLRWLEGAIADAPRPWFAYIGPHAPHFPAEPAPWHRDAFPSLEAPITPNYNASSPGKAQHVRQNPPLSARAKCWQDAHFRDRWAALLSVDDLVAELYELLAARAVLERTFVVYTSDHGYKQGQWRIGTSKQHPYETDIRVPFIIRGPGIAAASRFTTQLAGNVDVLPTLLELAAGAAFVRAVDPDGRSMLSFLLPQLAPSAATAHADTAGADAAADPAADPAAAEAVPWRDAFLNEYLSVGTYYNDHAPCWEEGTATTERCGGPMPRGPDGVNASAPCVEQAGVGNGTCYFVDSKHSNSWRQLRILNRTMNWNYVEFDPGWTFAEGERLQHYELYDIAQDPYQLHNLYESTDPVTRAALHAQLATYWQCKGSACP